MSPEGEAAFLAHVGEEFDASLGDEYAPGLLEPLAIAVGSDIDGGTYAGLCAAIERNAEAGQFATELEREQAFGFLDALASVPEPDVIAAQLESHSYLGGSVVYLEFPNVANRND